MQIDRQFAIFFDRLLNPENVRKNLTFVIGRATRKDISVLQNRIERRRIPQLQRIGRLHVVMSVNQNCVPTLLMLVARPNDRVPRGWNQFRLQSNTGQFLDQPVGAFAYSFRIIIVRGNAWKPQKRIEIFKMTGAHGCTLAKKSFRRSQLLHDESARKKMPFLQMTKPEGRRRSEYSNDRTSHRRFFRHSFVIRNSSFVINFRSGLRAQNIGLWLASPTAFSMILPL